MAEEEVTSQTPGEQLIQLNHEIRELEHNIRVAKRRRKTGNILVIVGPVTLVSVWLFSGFSKFRIESFNSQISTMVGLAGVTMLIKAIHYKLNPGGPRERPFRDDLEIFGDRKSESELELEIARLLDKRKLFAVQSKLNLMQRRLAYKAEAFSDVDRFRDESGHYRRIQNILQSILIVGSLATTGIAGISLLAPLAKWATMVTSFIVGIASGFIATFKYRERGTYLQQTADSIESEWEALELGVGRYKHYGSDAEGQEQALADFAEEVHRLKTEQKKREQNLDQPSPEARAGSIPGN